MSRVFSRRRVATASIASACSLFALGALERNGSGGLVKSAEAIIGRPATPASVAGVARRTTRRVVRRTSYYVATLPAGCAQMTISGAIVWHCGATYYQAEGSRYVIVEID